MYIIYIYIFGLGIISAIMSRVLGRDLKYTHKRDEHSLFFLFYFRIVDFYSSHEIETRPHDDPMYYN